MIHSYRFKSHPSYFSNLHTPSQQTFGRQKSHSGDQLPEKPNRFRWRNLLLIPLFLILSFAGHAFSRILKTKNIAAIQPQHQIELKKRQAKDHDFGAN